MILFVLMDAIFQNCDISVGAKENIWFLGFPQPIYGKDQFPHKISNGYRRNTFFIFQGRCVWLMAVKKLIFDYNNFFGSGHISIFFSDHTNRKMEPKKVVIIEKSVFSRSSTMKCNFWNLFTSMYFYNFQPEFLMAPRPSNVENWCLKISTGTPVDMLLINSGVDHCKPIIKFVFLKRQSFHWDSVSEADSANQTMTKGILLQGQYLKKWMFTSTTLFRLSRLSVHLSVLHSSVTKIFFAFLVAIL